MWEAIEIDGHIYRSRDPDTGGDLRVVGTPEIDVLKAVLRLPGAGVFELSLTCKSKQGITTYHDSSNPMIWIQIGSVKRMLERYVGTREEKSRLVRYLLEGIASINKRWPLCANPYFYSDIEIYHEKALPIDFDFPTDAELNRL